MKIKNIILFIFIYVSNVVSTFGHKLVHESFDSSARIARAVYIDETTGDLVVQKYNLSKTSIDIENFSFPKTVRSFANIYHPVSTLRPDIKEEKIIINMNQSSPKVQIEIEKAVGINREMGNELMSQINSDIYHSTNNKVIPSGSSKSNSGFAILSDRSGVLTFAKGKRKKTILPNKTVFPQDLLNTISGKTTKNLNVSTPGNIEKSFKKLSSVMKSYDFNKEQKQSLVDALTDKKNQLENKISKMSLVRSSTKDGKKAELFFDFENGSFYLRQSENNKIIDDEFYPISDDKNLEELKDKLERLSLYSKKDFQDSFDEFYVGGCEALESLSHLLPDLDSNIANILKVNDKLWGSYLENALSKSPIILDDGSIVLAVSALNQSHNIKIKINDGEVSNVEFLDLSKAERDGLEVKKIVENGKTYFKIISVDPNSLEKDQFFFELESHADGGENLAVYVKGNGETQNLYDKNTYKVSLLGKKVAEVGNRVHLSTEREDRYPSRISKGNGQGVKSFFFNTFFSLDSKRDKLKDEVQSAVKAQIGSINKDGKEYLNKREINDVILNIVADVEKDIPKLEGNVAKLTATTYEHAYKNFVSNIVPKMIKEIVPGESDDLYQDITKDSMIGFNACLKKASSKSNEKAAELCMNIYVKEAPIKIGESVLKYQLELNGQAALVNTSISEYTKCIKENYDPTQDMSYIKGCIFKAMFTAVDKDMEKVVSLSLKSMENDYEQQGKNVQLKVSKNVISNARENLRSCYQNKGYISPSIFKDNYNQRKLNNLDTESFKNDLLSCSSNIEQVVGREVSSSLLDYELNIMGIAEDDRELIRSKTVTKGYDNCIQIQKGIAKRDENNGKFTKIEAANCTDLVTLTATELVISNSLKDKLGDNLWAELEVRDRAPHIQCFEELLSKSRDELFGKNGKGINFDKESATCLKESVLWASYYIGEKELSNIFESDPLYRKVSLSKEKKNFYAQMIQKCFKDKLNKYNSVTEVSGALEKIQDQCTVELVMSEDARNDIVAPVVSALLEDSGVDPTVIDKTRDVIISKMRTNASNILSKRDLSLEQLVDEFKNIQGEATYVVADSTIDKYVHDLIPAESAADISLEVRQHIFEGKGKYKDKLMNAKNKNELDLEVSNMTELAAIDLTGHATRFEGLKLLEKGVLKSDAEVVVMSQNARDIMTKCLSERKQDQDLKEYLDLCVSKVKVEVTYSVFDDQLKSIIFNSPYSSAFSEEEGRKVYDELINDQLKNEIKSAYEDDNLSQLQTNFTLSATSKIGEQVLKKSISDIYTEGLTENSPSYQNKYKESIVVSNVANEELQSCLVSLRGIEGGKSDECINRARLKATTLVFKDKVIPFLSLLSNDKALQDKFMNTELQILEKCVEANTSDFNDYTDTVNGCLIEGIFDFVPNLSINISESSDLLSNLSAEKLSSYKECLNEKKRTLVKNNLKLKDKDETRKSLYRKIDQRENFWLEYFSESKDEDSQKKIDWAVANVQTCAMSSIVPEIVSSISESSALESKLFLNKEELAYTTSVLSEVKQFSKDTLSNGLWLKLSPSAPSVDGTTEESSLKAVSKYLNDYLPMIGDYLKKINAYDSAGSKEKLKKFLTTIKDELEKKKSLTLDELTELLMKSELIDLVIESEISSFIKREAQAPLAKEGVGPESINLLGSKEIISEIFKTKEGKKTILDIKDEFIKPMLNGKGAKAIPENIVINVKHLLVKDTKMGGFVETLAGAIVQKKLDDSKPRNFATSGIASLLGYNDVDFKWSHLRERKEEGVSDDDQPVSKAIEYFGDNILLPLLLDTDLGQEEKEGLFGRSSKVSVMDERKEKFTEMVEGLIDL